MPCPYNTNKCQVRNYKVKFEAALNEFLDKTARVRSDQMHAWTRVPPVGIFCSLFLCKDFYECTFITLAESICAWLQMNIGDFCGIFPDGWLKVNLWCLEISPQQSNNFSVKNGIWFLLVLSSWGHLSSVKHDDKTPWSHRSS